MMKDELEKTQRLLEQATAAGDAPADGLDPELAHLREAWLLFGEMLESAQPPTTPQIEYRKPTLIRRHRWFWTAAAAMAVSLLIGLVTTWMLHDTNGETGPAAMPGQTASTDHPNAGSTLGRAEVNGLQWDDSLDEQFAQVSQQMAYARNDRLPGADPFGSVWRAMERARLEIQSDTF